jgi:hypothetical protein
MGFLNPPPRPGPVECAAWINAFAWKSQAQPALPLAGLPCKISEWGRHLFSAIAGKAVAAQFEEMPCRSILFQQ